MSAIVKPPKRAMMPVRSSSSGSVAPRSRYEKQRAQVQMVAPIPPRSRAQSVHLFPNVQSRPGWLTWLTTVQRGSTVVTFSLVASVLAVYSWTVYAQAAFGREYRRLENYQALERRLTPAIEALKDWLASQAETPDSGLVLPSSSSAIFLEPAPPRPISPHPSPITPGSAPPSIPMGY